MASGITRCQLPCCYAQVKKDDKVWLTNTDAGRSHLAQFYEYTS